MLVAAAVAGEKKVAKAITPTRIVEAMFVTGGKKSAFGDNVWYESPEATITSQKRVWQFWDVTRPTRQIEKISGGEQSCGCTWVQLDGRRGASYFSFNSEGKITFVREVPEPQGWGKFRENNMSALQPAFGIMEGIKNFFSINESYLIVEENKEPLKPRFGLQAPRSRRASDVVRYLWEEAYCAEEGAVDRVLAEYSDSAVYEDMTYVEEVWPRGMAALRKYQQETKDKTPRGLRFVLDEVTEGTKACAVLWHVEYLGKKSPRGVSFYELDEAGKVSYVRASYDISF